MTVSNKKSDASPVLLDSPGKYNTLNRTDTMNVGKFGGTNPPPLYSATKTLGEKRTIEENKHLKNMGK
jgi:hypothetical protein